MLGLVEGDPATALSHVPRFLFDAIDRRFSVVERLDYSPHSVARLGVAAATFRPSRSAWRARFHTSRLAHRVLTAMLRRRLARVREPFDLALQIFGWVAGQPRPYALYVDQTRLMAERGWPQWLPFSRRERGVTLALEQRMYRDAFHLFAMGEAGRESLIADYDIDPARITVADGGLNYTGLPPVGEASPDPILLFVGRDFDRKGGGVLLEAFRQVRNRLPLATLHIVGTSRRIEDPGVVVHGMTASRERLGEVYRSARAFCLPSHYEPWGLVLVEAMAHGIPCIGSAVQSIPHILDHGRAGLLVEPGNADDLADAAIALLTDDDLAATLGAAGRQRVEQEFTWDRVVERMAPALERVGAERGA